ncbi:MAG: PQQ-dependent sugar dehydrogenase [Bacteroidota bacterium]|nr:PQQ-dependent sugar dehydrogenase [Bacteroidota bacterium]
MPKGNLFAQNMPKTQPEIYFMGSRIPYRITIDPKTNVLYWCEVGPDAGKRESQAYKDRKSFDE